MKMRFLIALYHLRMALAAWAIWGSCALVIWAGGYVRGLPPPWLAPFRYSTWAWVMLGVFSLTVSIGWISIIIDRGKPPNRPGQTA